MHPTKVLVQGTREIRRDGLRSKSQKNMPSGGELETHVATPSTTMPAVSALPDATAQVKGGTRETRLEVTLERTVDGRRTSRVGHLCLLSHRNKGDGEKMNLGNRQNVLGTCSGRGVEVPPLAEALLPPGWHALSA
jgi:hypothetical protein